MSQIFSTDFVSVRFDFYVYVGCYGEGHQLIKLQYHFEDDKYAPLWFSLVLPNNVSDTLYFCHFFPLVVYAISLVAIRFHLVKTKGFTQ